nr:MAG TPA: conotoxin [Caudoviricetes sp.]
MVNRFSATRYCCWAGWWPLSTILIVWHKHHLFCVFFSISWCEKIF